jgi:plastocyanin
MTRIVVLLAGFLLLAACSSGGTSAPQSYAPTSSASASSAPAAAADATITISNFQFGSPQSVRPGATIAVVNSDGAEHSVTADEGKTFDVDVEGNGTATFTAPSQPGTYAYHCKYHPMMHGQLIVK